MAIAGTDNMNRMEQDSYMEFVRSIIAGVEIKLCRNNPHAYKHHVHEELSLGYIVEGSTELTLNDWTIHFGAGDGIIIPPLMTHRCSPNDIEHWAYIMLFVDPAYYSDAVSFDRAKKLTGGQTEKLVGFIGLLQAEKDTSALETILIELLLEFGEKNMPDIVPASASESVRAVHDYILSHVKEEITLDRLQQLSGLNKFSLIRNFRKLYASTPRAFHLQYRVAEAKRMLGEGAEVFDICGELGFYDQVHLIREFKKMYGVTPGAYLEQLKG